MKNVFIASMVIAALIFLTSCVPEWIEIPPGVWQSDDPKITLYFMPDYQIPGSAKRYLGFIIENGNERRIFTQFWQGPILRYMMSIYSLIMSQLICRESYFPKLAHIQAFYSLADIDLSMMRCIFIFFENHVKEWEYVP